MKTVGIVLLLAVASPALAQAPVEKQSAPTQDLKPYVDDPLPVLSIGGKELTIGGKPLTPAPVTAQGPAASQPSPQPSNTGNA
jgi:hypothetical protein